MSSDATTTTGAVVAGDSRAGGPDGLRRGEAGYAAGRMTAGGPDELARRRIAWVVAGLALGGMVLASLLVVGIAAARPSFVSPPSLTDFPGWMAGPLGWIGRPLHYGQDTIKLILSCSVGAMFVAYLAVLACASRLRPRWALGAVVVLELIFFLSPPLPLTDIFNYVNYGRMEVLHGLNPYTTIPALGPPSDPTFLLSNWHQLLSPYGPLFTIFSFALVPLGVAASFWVIKAGLLLASLAILWLVWRSAELVGRDPLPATLFVGLNPLVLFWGLGGDHNDFFMVFFVMLAVYLLLRARELRSGDGGPDTADVEDRPAGEGRWPRGGWGSLLDGAAWPPRAGEAGPAREVGAGFALIAAVAIKASAGILLPVVLLGVGRRLRVLAGMLAGAVVFGAASIYAFGLNLPNLAQQSTLVTLAGIPNVLGYVFGLGGESDSLKTVFAGVLAVSVLAAALWSWRTRRWIGASAFATVILLVTLSWALPWYVLWLLPLAALARGRGVRVAALAVSLYLLLIWVPNMTDVIHAIGYKPSLTRLGQERQQKTLLLLH
jgi:hypothetical protein